MKVIGINGSPRKGWNTHQLVEKALAGAASAGAETELVNLYDLTFTGCLSCFQCKNPAGTTGVCVLKDGLAPVLAAARGADALVVGSPIYIDDVTAGTRAFIERLAFENLTYQGDPLLFDPRRIPVLLLYTTNCPEDAYEKVGYTNLFARLEKTFERFVGPARTFYASETWQTEDYAKYRMTMFDVPARKKRREEVFPAQLEEVYRLGASLLP
jgi:NAD(P)H-dependent FMN reductase